MKFFVPCVPLVFLAMTAPVSADYLLILKNGRQITVQTYREEGSMIKFYGFGGEIGISKDQIQSVAKIAPDGSSGLSVSIEQAPRENDRSLEAPAEPTRETVVSPEEERERLEKDYQQNLIDITEKLKEAQERYSQSIRGTSSTEPNLQFSEEQRAAMQDDVISRYRDATSNPSEPAPVKLLTPSPFTSLPPTIVEERPIGRPPISVDNLPINDRQRELSDLRNQAIQLEKERDKLINEMREKNLKTGSLFLQ
jgi:hypothetical protein